MPPAIPPRQPVEDRFEGYLFDDQGETLIAAAPPEGVSARAGEWIVRYGIRYLGKPHLSIIPGLVAVDYGEMLNGEEAWQFLLRRSNLYPRAEVFGFRNDGRDEMTYVRNLDFVQPIEVLLFDDPVVNLPSARPKALIAADDTQLTHTAARLTEYLPCFDSLAAWRASRSLT